MTYFIPPPKIQKTISFFMTDSILTQFKQNNNKLEKLDKWAYVEKTYLEKILFLFRNQSGFALIDLLKSGT